MVILNGVFKNTVKIRYTDFYVEDNWPFISQKPWLIYKTVLTFPKHFVFTKMSLYLIYEKKRR
jgi:hypothetical protein